MELLENFGHHYKEIYFDSIIIKHKYKEFYLMVVCNFP